MWHSAHLPDARTNAADRCSVSTLGRARLTRNALTTRANAITTAMKTGRNDMGSPSYENPIHRPPAPTDDHSKSDANATALLTRRDTSISSDSVTLRRTV